MTDEEYIPTCSERFSQFLRQRCKGELVEIRNQYPHDQYLLIDLMELGNWGREGFHLVDRVISNPAEMVDAVLSAIISDKLIWLVDEEDRVGRLQIGFVNSPKRDEIRNLRSTDIGTLVSVSGIVRWITPVLPEVTYARYRCRICGRMVWEAQEIGKLKRPLEPCPECEAKSSFMEYVPSLSRYKDVQKITIQESPEGLRGGEQPKQIEVKLERELVDKLVPGGRCTITGILLPVEKKGQSLVMDYYISAVGIEKASDDYSEIVISSEEIEEITALSQMPDIHDVIAESVAPSIYGQRGVKRAISLMLFGGVRKLLADGSFLRGDSHILLVGDPGIAKSQILKRVASISPRGIFTSGKGASSAGLTASVTKDADEGRFVLEAGALVLSDGGVCCIDEMDKMSPDDRSALHEAMEQQEVSIAKAGIVATLKSRCSLLSAANPKMGRFDDYEPVADQINMPPSLLSRYDLIFVMVDDPQEDMDRKLAQYILNSHESPSGRTGVIETDMLRKYIAFARKNCSPKMSSEVGTYITEFYVGIRKRAGRGKSVPITPRQIDAIVRMSEASAKIRLADVVSLEDATRAIDIFEDSMGQVAYDAETNNFDVDRFMSPFSKGKRDKIHTLLEIVREEQCDSRIIEKAEAAGMTGVREKLDQLLEEGILMRPRSGILREV